MKNINVYRLELGACRRPVLVLEKTFEYNAKSFGFPLQVVNLLNSIFYLNKLAEEKVLMIAVDAKGQVLGLFDVSHGTVNACYCNPRELFLRALLVGATGIIVAHNHPSGICTPSNDDKQAAKRIKTAGEIIGIDMLDFIIISDDEYYSFQEEKEF